MSARAGNAILLFLTLLISLLGSEWALRRFRSVARAPLMTVADTFVEYRLKPNVRGRAYNPRVFDYTWTTNSQGLRATRDYAIPKPAGTKRVLFIGDSFTFGLGVNDDETTPARVQQAFAAGCAGDSVEVLNGGLGGYNTGHELEFYERYGSVFTPDVVVMDFFTNDVVDMHKPFHRLVGDSAVPLPVAQRPSILTEKKITNLIPGYEWLLEHSALVNGIRHAYVRYMMWRMPAGNQKPLGTEERWRSDTFADSALWQLEAALFQRFKAQTTARGAQPLIALFMDRYSAELYFRGHPEQAVTIARAKELCAKTGIECVDVATHFVERVSRPDYKKLFIEGDGHFTALGQGLAAEAIVPAVRARLGCDIAPPAQKAAAP